MSKAKGTTEVVTSDSYAWMDFPIPGSTGDITAAFLNQDVALGPITATMRMAAGSRIPAHVHSRTTETFLVLDGSFVNAGIAYGPGTFFAVKAGDVHGPHETETGCTLLFAQAVEVDPTDFRIAE